MKWKPSRWQESLRRFEEFFSPIGAALGRAERRRNAAYYIQGLLLPGERKSVEPLAERLRVDSQRLQQFIADSPWSDEAAWRALAGVVLPHMDPVYAWIVDESGWIKQGRHSVGVAPQYCGAVGKTANCQVIVSVHVSNGSLSCPLRSRLYLPEKWAQDARRRKAAGVPAAVRFVTKPALALELIRALVEQGVERAPVLADSAYGDSFEWRRALRELGLEYLVQVEGETLQGWTQAPQPVRRRTRFDYSKVERPQSLARIVADWGPQLWKPAHWKDSAKRWHETRLGVAPVYCSHGASQGKAPAPAEYLVVDWPEGKSQPYHYFLGHFLKPPSLARLLRLGRMRWQIEQNYQRLKTDLGLDHYEGRSWQGLHHHLVMAAVAYAFVMLEHGRIKKNFWCDVGGDPGADPAVVAAVDRVLSFLPDLLGTAKSGP